MRTNPKTKEEYEEEARILLRRGKCNPAKVINDNNGALLPDEPYGFIYELNDGTMGFPSKIPEDNLSMFTLDIDLENKTHYFIDFIGNKKDIKVFNKTDVARFYFGLGKTVKKTYWTGANKLRVKFNAFKTATESELMHILGNCKIYSIKKPTKKNEPVGYVKIGVLPHLT